MSFLALRRVCPISRTSYFISDRTTFVVNRFLSHSFHQKQINTDAAHEADEFYDIIIAGGGIVGTVCSVALATSPFLSNKKVLLLETSPSFSSGGYRDYETSPPPLSNRVFALSPGSRKFLERINVWSDLYRFKEVFSMQVLDANSNSNLQINNPGFSEPVSYIVENPLLLRALEMGLTKATNVTVKYGCSLGKCVLPSVGNSNDYAETILSNGEKVSASLVIGADGYNSKVRSCMGSPYVSGSYDRTAVVATLQLTEPTENNTAWQRFLPTGGPVALLPLSSDHSSLVWSTYPANAKRLMALTDEEFVNELNTALGHQFPQSPVVVKTLEILYNIGLHKPGILPPSISTVVPKSRATFPLGFGHSAHYVNRRSALIGDAAHRVHPLGGQGLNLGIGDVASLLKVLENCSSVGENIGGLESLKSYETERQRHNLSIQSSLHFLHHIYGSNAAPAVVARSVGLSVVNSSDTIKNCIIAQAAA